MKKECESELQPGEIWLGNTPYNNGQLRDDLSPLKTIRMGLQAYDYNDNPIDPNYMRPLIIHKSEEHLYDQIYNEQLKSINRKY